MRWIKVPGKLMQVESGPSGAVWGVSKSYRIYYRFGVCRHRPRGRYWIRVRGRLQNVSPGCTGVYGCDRYGKIFRYNGKYELLWLVSLRSWAIVSVVINIIYFTSFHLPLSLVSVFLMITFRQSCPLQIIRLSKRYHQEHKQRQETRVSGKK